MRDYLPLVLGGMRRRSLRSWLTVLGIVIGVAAIVSLISVSNGFKFAVEHQFRQMGLSNIRVAPADLRGPPTGNLGLPNSLIGRLERVKGVEYVSPTVMAMQPVEFSDADRFVWVMGYDTALSDKGFLDIDIEVQEGRLFRPGEGDSAIIGAKVAEDAFPTDVHLRNTLVLGGRQFKVVGIFERTGGELDERIYIPLDSARALFGDPDRVNVLVVKLQDGVSTEEGEERIGNELSREIESKEVEVYTPEDLLSQFFQVLDVVQFVLVGIAAISLLVGTVGIMNAMFTAVLERTREIGVMKATGASNTQVIGLFLLESGLLGLAGGAIGLLGGMVFAFIVEAAVRAAGFPYLDIRVELPVVGTAMAVACISGTLAGLLPAMRASRLSPVEALRYE